MLQRQAVSPKTLELLRGLVALPLLFDSALAGGTALALRCGHRLSIDLDIFFLRDFDEDQVLHQIKETFEKTLAFGKAKNTLNLGINGVKVDILSHQYPILNDYEIEEGIPLYSLKDLAAMKLSAAAQRGSKKDFYDLLELSDYFSLGQMLGFHGQKYGLEGQFYLIKSLAYFDDADNEPDPVSLKDISWSDVKTGWQTIMHNFLKEMNQGYD